MSTPTPSNSANQQQPSSASKKATTANHVSTPSYLGLSSPAPRSVPSPATARKDQQAAKTPGTSSVGSKTIGGAGAVGTPMMHTLSQTAYSASPLGSGTPGLTGLGVDMTGGGSSTGGGGPPSSTAGSTMMMPSMSDLGLGLTLTTSGKGRNEDEERRAKMRRVLKSIGRPKGRVSEEGIARVSRRVGFQNDIDAERLTAEEKARRVGNRTISIAGKTVLIDVELKENVPRGVQVMISGEGKGLEEQGALASKVLENDLKLGEKGLAVSGLERFAANLDKLARMDRISDKINCFDAICGVYDGLRRLYEAEKEAVKALQSADSEDSDRSADIEVMRKRSGRPSIHDRGKIGLVVDYWTMDTNISSTKNNDAMEVDNAASVPSPVPDSETYSLRIEAEVSSAALYPALRISGAWLPQDLKLPAPDDDSALGIPWEDPPPTYLPPDTSQPEGLPTSDSSKLPDLRFVARLDPPIVVPYPMAMSILSTLGMTSPQLYSYLPYHLMLLNTPLQTIQSGAAAVISSKQSVLRVQNGEETEASHVYILDISKAEYAYRLEELPFSHPKQIIDLLPTLRQWAHFGALVRGALSDPTYRSAANATNGTNESMSEADVLASPSTSARSPKVEPLEISVTLVTAPQPTMALTYVDPAAAADDVHNIVAQILPNAEITVMSQADVGGGTDGDVAMRDGEETETSTMAKVLTVCGDVGVWLEWLRGREG